MIIVLPSKVFLLKFLKELEKQLQFITGEKKKIQHALGAVKRQWEEYQATCGGSHKVRTRFELQPFSFWFQNSIILYTLEIPPI